MPQMTAGRIQISKYRDVTGMPRLLTFRRNTVTYTSHAQDPRHHITKRALPARILISWLCLFMTLGWDQS